MSMKWPGGLIRKTPVTPAGPIQNGAAPGMWTLAEASYWTKQGLWPIAGNFLAVEDVFSTYLYTGNGSTQTITNGINLSGSGGLVWSKSRVSAQSHFLIDSANALAWGLSNATNAYTPVSAAPPGVISSFNANGYTLGLNSGVNLSGEANVSWTFREAPKFFDVVTYTGNGANRNIAHNLGVAPGMILVKRTDAVADWQVYHRSLANTQYMVLNTQASLAAGATRWNSTTPTATEFTVGTDTTVNASGGTYVAYLYAHDTASDGLIQCGSYTGNGSATGPTVTLGWEPQWLLVKRATGGTSSWFLIDSMRGLTMFNDNLLYAESTASQETGYNVVNPTATGFNVVIDDPGFNTNGNTYVYMAIRRGPMRTPTLGTSVFAPLAVTPVTGTVRTTGFPVDLSIAKTRTLIYPSLVTDRLRGFVNNTSPNPPTLITTSTDAETTATYSPASYAFDNTGYKDGPELNGGYPTAYWNFRRAPGFFDTVCYTGTGANRTVAHNLGVAPELMIIKLRNFGENWSVYYYPNSSMYLNGANAGGTAGATLWNNTDPTSTVFSLGTNGAVNNSGGADYVAYLFASAPGVSKVGSYTGNGSSQTINCAFTTGARFVLIKRTDATGSWLVWDSARGIVAGNDPYLALNNTNAEVTTNDSVDTDNTGFIVNQVAASNINVNAATYIFLAIA